MTAYRFFSIKNVQVQQQFNIIINITQLTNDQICQNFIVTVNVWRVYHQLPAPTQSFNRSVLVASCPR